MDLWPIVACGFVSTGTSLFRSLGRDTNPPSSNSTLRVNCLVRPKTGCCLNHATLLGRIGSQLFLCPFSALFEVRRTSKDHLWLSEISNRRQPRLRHQLAMWFFETGRIKPLTVSPHKPSETRVCVCVILKLKVNLEFVMCSLWCSCKRNFKSIELKRDT